MACLKGEEGRHIATISLHSLWAVAPLFLKPAQEITVSLGDGIVARCRMKREIKGV